jgi:hypothetical protein
MVFEFSTYRMGFAPFLVTRLPLQQKLKETQCSGSARLVRESTWQTSSEQSSLTSRPLYQNLLERPEENRQESLR